MSAETENRLTVTILFHKTPKKGVERGALFKKLRSLLKQERKSLPFENIEFDGRARVAVLAAKEFYSVISFLKPFTMTLIVTNPLKSIEKTNELANTLVNYMNTVLGEYAKGAEVRTSEFSPWKKGKINLARKLIGERKIAKINESIKKTLDPFGLLFEFSSNGRKNIMVTALLEKRGSVLALSRYTYKNALPWDLLSSEHSNLLDCMRIIDKLSKVEV